jgi:hypothetical protein
VTTDDGSGFPSRRGFLYCAKQEREAAMHNPLCRIFGHKKTRVVFSTSRYYCGRCKADLGGPCPRRLIAALPPTTIKRGTPQRFRRWAEPTPPRG